MKAEVKAPDSCCCSSIICLKQFRIIRTPGYLWGRADCERPRPPKQGFLPVTGATFFGSKALQAEASTEAPQARDGVHWAKVHVPGCPYTFSGRSDFITVLAKTSHSRGSLDHDFAGGGASDKGKVSCLLQVARGDFPAEDSTEVPRETHCPCIVLMGSYLIYLHDFAGGIWQGHGFLLAASVGDFRSRAPCRSPKQR